MHNSSHSTAFNTIGITVNPRRYLVCGVVSVALHSLALSAQQPSIELTLTDTQQLGQRVAIALISPPKPKVIEQETPKLTETKPHKIKPAPAKPKPIKKPEPKKIIEKKQPEKIEDETPEPKKDQPEPKEQAVQVAKATTPPLVTQPSFKIKPVQPKYPRIAKRKGMQGQVLIEIWLDENGLQIKQIILQSSGHQVLDDAAMRAIKAWRFNGHKAEGIALAHRVRIPIRFNLD